VDEQFETLRLFSTALSGNVRACCFSHCFTDSTNTPFTRENIHEAHMKHT